MIWLYRFLFFPVLLISLPFYLTRMLRRGGYKEGFSERAGAGFLPPRDPATTHRIWVQAVSVGELLAVGPILRQLDRREGVEIILTTTTSTGYRLARERFGEWVTAIRYFPLDSWFFSRRAWRKFAPDAVIHMESEVWPEHLHQASLRKVPVFLLNARLSDRSFRRFSMVPKLSAQVGNLFTAILTASQEDERRWKSLGVDPAKVHFVGNLKCDGARAPELSENELSSLREELGLPNGPILLGSSTWPGEEEILLEILQSLRKKHPSTRLLIVPRHEERRRDVLAAVGKKGFSAHLRSKGKAPAEVAVAVADTTGELGRLTALAEVVFIGKSLPPNKGGQTPLEAIAAGKPVVMGPRMGNFRDLVASMVRENAALQVADEAELQQTIQQLFDQPEERQALGQQATQWLENHRGASSRIMRWLDDHLFS